MTLPATAGLPSGASFTIVCTNVNGTVITPAGGDVIASASGGTASLSMKNGESIVLARIAAGTWLALGTAALSRSKSFSNNLLNGLNQGFQEFPSGLITQWVAASGTGVTEGTVTLPFAFPLETIFACIWDYGNVTAVPSKMLWRADLSTKGVIGWNSDTAPAGFMVQAWGR